MASLLGFVAMTIRCRGSPFFTTRSHGRYINRKLALNQKRITSVVLFCLSFCSPNSVFVGLSGFEPELKRPKRLVLPLHYSPFIADTY